MQASRVWIPFLFFHEVLAVLMNFGELNGGFLFSSGVVPTNMMSVCVWECIKKLFYDKERKKEERKFLLPVKYMK